MDSMDCFIMYLIPFAILMYCGRRLCEILAKVEEYKEENETLRKNLSQVEENLESTKTRFEETETECNDLQKSVNTSEQLVKDLTSRVEEYEQENENLRKKLSQVEDKYKAAEENFESIQRRFEDKETECKDLQESVNTSEQLVKDLTSRVEEYEQENENLRKKLSQVEGKYKTAEENFKYIKRRFEDEETECKDLQESVTRLQRACTDQGKTIVGFLEEFSEEMRKVDNFGDDNHVAKLQIEQLRLTGVELSLRREVESYRREIDSLRREMDSLRREDSYIFNHLKGNGKEIGPLTIKLGMELRSHVYCLQNEGLGMLTESTQLSSQLLEFVQESSKGVDNVLDRQFVLESKSKIQGFKNGIEGLTKCLQNTSTLLHENQTLEETGRLETKEETLSTRLLREKLYCKELKVEQLQAELETAKVKMLEKDEKMKQLQSDLRSCAELQRRRPLPEVTDDKNKERRRPLREVTNDKNNKELAARKKLPYII